MPRNDIEQGLLYPPLHELREISARITAAVAGAEFDAGAAGIGPRTALVPRFTLQACHDVVHGNGSVPLYILEDLVDDWIASTSRRTELH